MLLILLSIASSVSPFGMVVVVPTLSEVAQTYGVDYSQTQFLISAYLFGLGVAQPVCGALADRFGRRRVILVGFFLFAIASIICALTADMGTLVAMRFLQAVGVSVGTVGSRAIVRDTHDAEGTVRALSFIAAAMGVAPMLAPAIGGAVSESYGAQSVFYLSAAVGIAVCLALWALLPETRPDQVGEPAPKHGLWLRYWHLLSSRVFLGYTLMFGLVQGSMFCFLAVGSAVFEQDFQIGQRGFGLIWAGMALSYVVGTVVGGRLAQRFGSGLVMVLGMGLNIVGGVALFGSVATFGTVLVPVVGSLTLMSVASGFITPISLAGAVSFRPDIAGTCAGLSSSLGLVLSGMFTVIAGSLYRGDFAIITVLVVMIAIGTAITGLMVRRRPLT